MKIKPMGENKANKSLLSEQVKNTIQSEMKLNSLFGFDASTHTSVPAYALIRLATVDMDQHTIFSNIPVEDLDVTREYMIHPNYSIVELERDENGNVKIPGFQIMDKNVTMDFKVMDMKKEEDDLKITLKNILQITNSSPSAPEKIEITATLDNTFEVWGGNYFMIITIKYSRKFS